MNIVARWCGARDDGGKLQTRPKLSRTFVSTQIEVWFNEPSPSNFLICDKCCAICWCFFLFFWKRRVKVHRRRPEWASSNGYNLVRLSVKGRKKRVRNDKKDKQLGEGCFTKIYVWFNCYKLRNKSKIICAFFSCSSLQEIKVHKAQG